jgi:hypothetical protein
MFVTNHVLSGVLVGRFMRRRPAAAFFVGVGSHLVLDALPHWGCSVATPEGLDRFLTAAKRDGVLGLATMAVATLAVDPEVRTSTIAAMAGAVLLDLDKPFTYFFGVNPFPRRINELHRRVQNESPQGMRNEIGFGAVCAALDVMTRSVDPDRLRR